MRRVLVVGGLLLVGCGSTGGAVDAGACPAPTDGGTSHTATVMSAETWTAAASPHLIPSGLTLRAAVTLEPCAVVQLGADKVLSVGADGSLIANGEADRPITFERQDPTKAWSQIRAFQGGTIRLVHARLLGGGAPLNSPIDNIAAVDVRGPDQTQPPGDFLHVDHVLIKDSASMGVLLREAGGFTSTSTDLTIQGSAHAPIDAWASAAGTIPSGTYTGNAVDEVILEGSGLGAVSRDVVFRDRGVPYRVGDSLAEGRLDVAAPATGPIAVLTLEPGVKLRFKKGGALFVQVSQNTAAARGALVAASASGKPIVFTSAEATPAAGDWLGVHFNGLVDAKSKLDHVRVEYAGGTTSLVGASCKYPDNANNAAAIRVFVEPATAFITNTTVVASARHGIDRGWLGTTGISFVGGTNDLAGAAMCKETHPTPNGAACPMPVPCP